MYAHAAFLANQSHEGPLLGLDNMAPVQVVDNYYAILEVPESADDGTIKSSYRRLARLNHPDKNKNPNATAKFQLVSTPFGIQCHVF